MTVAKALELAAQYHFKGILLDANLLLLFFIGGVDRALIPESTMTSKYTAIDFDLLLKLLGESPKLVVTPHVATEVSNLGGKLGGKRRTKFFELFDRFLRVAQERAVEVKYVVEDPMFIHLGLTDGGLLRMKRRLPLVITDDFRLYLKLEERRRPVINFSHLREEILLA